jgi:hypothetical protein
MITIFCHFCSFSAKKLAFLSRNLCCDLIFLQFSLKKRLPGEGSEPGSSRYHLCSHFHHITAEPQRLPCTILLCLESKTRILSPIFLSKIF